MNADLPKVDAFLFSVLHENDRNGVFVRRAETLIVAFLLDPLRDELEFPPLNSYHRRILHRLGQHYQLERRVEASNLFNIDSPQRKLVLSKPHATTISVSSRIKLPVLKCSDWLPDVDREAALFVAEQETCETAENVVDASDSATFDSATFDNATFDNATSDNAIADADSTPSDNTPSASTTPQNSAMYKILKRADRASDRARDCVSQSSASTSVLDSLSLAERETRYQAARERIFKDFVPSAEEGESSDSNGPSGIGCTPQQTQECVHEAAVTSQSHGKSLGTLSTLNPNAMPFAMPLPISPPPIEHIHLLETSESPLTREMLEQLVACSNSLVAVSHIPASWALLVFPEKPVANPASLDAFLTTHCCELKPWRPALYPD